MQLRRALQWFTVASIATISATVAFMQVDNLKMAVEGACVLTIPSGSSIGIPSGSEYLVGQTIPLDPSKTCTKGIDDSKNGSWELAFRPTALSDNRYVGVVVKAIELIPLGLVLAATGIAAAPYVFKSRPGHAMIRRLRRALAVRRARKILRRVRSIRAEMFAANADAVESQQSCDDSIVEDNWEESRYWRRDALELWDRRDELRREAGGLLASRRT